MHVEKPNAGPFGTAAIESINRSEFKPGMLHGAPVPVRVEVWVPFVEGEKRAVPEVMPLIIYAPTRTTDHLPLFVRLGLSIPTKRNG